MKNKIRMELKEQRRNMTVEDAVEKSDLAAEIFLKSTIYKNAKTLMLYMPLGKETDTGRIIERAFEDGKRTVLPLTDAKSGNITPVFFDKNTVFKKGSFSVLEPQEGEFLNKTKIDVVIVPGIAFSPKGGRVGFGKGCYDMFLVGMDAVKVGLCYEFQLCEDIPLDEHDVKMDYIVTEKRLISCK